MNKPESTSAMRSFATLACAILVALLAVPSVGLAQDPVGDQYAPTPPSGTGDPTSPTDPGTGPTDPGTDPDPDSEPVPTAGDDTTGGGTGGGDTGGDSSNDPVVVAPTGTVPTAASATASDTPAAESSGNKAQRTLGGLAADAQQQRDARAVERARPQAELLSSDADSGDGMGLLLPILIGAILIWAAFTGIANLRRHNADPRNGQPA